MNYSNYTDMMKFTEELLAEMVKSVTGGYEVKVHNGKMVDFRGPYQRVPIVAGLEEKMKVKMPEEF